MLPITFSQIHHLSLYCTSYTGHRKFFYLWIAPNHVLTSCSLLQPNLAETFQNKKGWNYCCSCSRQLRYWRRDWRIRLISRSPDVEVLVVDMKNVSSKHIGTILHNFCCCPVFQVLISFMSLNNQKLLKGKLFIVLLLFFIHILTNDNGDNQWRKLHRFSYFL